MTNTDWIETGGRLPDLPRDAVIYARGRMGDVYGPLPFEMFSEDAWLGYMLHYSHDLDAYALRTSRAQDGETRG